jgi:glycosyltransferase involved in cell wall biosynthesis
MPLVTVIIPAYNAGATLSRTLASALNQTHRKLEVFVVDDGSTDDTAEVARQAAARDARLHLLRQKNAGVAAARNLALSRASGEFTAWLDADDLWHPRKIEAQLGVYFQAPAPPSFVYTGYRLIDAHDRIIPNFRTLADISGQSLCRQIATNYFTNVSSILAPTRLVRHLDGHSPELRKLGMEGGEDLLLQLRLSMHGPVARCRDALVGYRMHDSNMSRDHLRAARSNLKALEIVQSAANQVPAWAYRLGRARTVGYCLHLVRDLRLLAAMQLFARLFSGQPLFTLITLASMVHWQVRHSLASAGDGEPEIGENFFDADPRSVPWLGHMVLPEYLRDRLEAADSHLSTGWIEPRWKASRPLFEPSGNRDLQQTSFGELTPGIPKA